MRGQFQNSSLKTRFPSMTFTSFLKSLSEVIALVKGGREFGADPVKVRPQGFLFLNLGGSSMRELALL